MKNKYSLLLIGVIALVGVVTCYELLQVIAPYYSYGRAVTLFVSLGIGIYLTDIFTGNQRKEETSISDSYMQLQNSWISYLKKHIQPIGYISFILCIIGVLLSMFFNAAGFFKVLVITYFVLFFIQKFLGFRPEMLPKKEEKLSPAGLKIFIVVLSVFVIFLGLILTDYAVPSEYKLWYYITGIGLFILGAKFLFLKSSFDSKKILRPYNLGMYAMILGILGYMGWNAYKEAKFLKEIENNPYYQRGEPGLMSDEAYLNHIGVKEAESFTGKVAESYTLEAGLSVGSEGPAVQALEEVLQKLGYLTGQVDDIFEEDTQLALRNTLIERCDWPVSTKGIFGPLSKECLDEQELSFTKEVEYIQQDEQIISDEVSLEEAIGTGETIESNGTENE